MRVVFFILTLILLISSPMINAESVEQIMSPGKTITNFGSYLKVQGRWKKIQTNLQHGHVAHINTVSITCDKQSLICQEIVSEVATPKDAPILSHPFLLVHTLEYKVLEWSENTIHAKCEAGVADLEIKIALKDNVVERRFRETKTRGSITANPDLAESWILE